MGGRNYKRILIAKLVHLCNDSIPSSEIEDVFKNTTEDLLRDASDSEEEEDITEVTAVIKECESLLQVSHVHTYKM